MLKVVLIDDESLSKRGIRRLIENMPDCYTVAGEASDGEEGFRLIQRINPDLVITDIRMPKKNGLEMIQAIRESHPDTRIVIISGHDNFEYAQQAIRLGVTDYILKPVHIPEFIRLLEQIALMNPEKKPDAPETVDKIRNPSIIQRALEYIHKNYHQPLNQSMLADKVNLSEGYFSKLFKNETGKNYQDYLQQYRLDRAKEYLQTTNLKIYEIAQMVGYEDAKYFHVIFKRYTGLTPMAYRENLGAEKED